jgi:hypothetical protein
MIVPDDISYEPLPSLCVLDELSHEGTVYLMYGISFEL